MSRSSRPRFKYGQKYCQHDEEAIVLTVFDAIGHKGTLCDIGARLMYSNSARLIFEHGYSGVLVDIHKEAARELETRFSGYPVEVFCQKATVDNVNEFVRDADFLSIDIDTYDWWLWAFANHSPRLVCVEINPHITGLQIVKYNEHAAKMYGGKMNGYNASKGAFELLGRLKGYSTIALTGTNMIFARNDIAGRASESLLQAT